MDDLRRIWRGDSGGVGASDYLSCIEKLTATRQSGDLGEDLDFSVGLRLIVGIGMRRLPSTDAIERKDGIAFSDCCVYI